MQANERRRKIIECISLRRYVTMQSLAAEFDVSWYTVYRDIQYLLEEYPLIVTQGKGGGVTLPEGYYVSQRHLTPKQADAVRRNLDIVGPDDRKTFESILSDFAWK